MVCFIQDLQYAKDQHTTVFMFNFRGLSIAKSLQSRISLADRIWRKTKDLKMCPHNSYLPDAAMCMASINESLFNKVGSYVGYNHLLFASPRRMT